MKQSEKRDLILQFLYKRRHEDYLGLMLDDVMKQLDIYESPPDVDRIAGTLKNDDLVNLVPFEEGSAKILNITTRGIDYCEETSYSQPGTAVTALTFNFHGAVSATNMVMGKDISNVHQTETSSNSEAGELIRKIRESIQDSTGIDKDKEEVILECVNDIEEKIKNQKPVRKYQLHALIENTANIAQVSGFAIQLAQVLGLPL